MYSFFIKYKNDQKNVNFEDKKKNKKSDFYENKKVAKIDVINGNISL